MVQSQRMEVERGGHWRFVEHGPDGVHGFEGRYREVRPLDRIVQTFEWDGMPGYVSVDTILLEAMPDQRTRVVDLALFHTQEERDGMISAGMEQGLSQSYDEPNFRWLKDRSPVRRQIARFPGAQR